MEKKKNCAFVNFSDFVTGAKKGGDTGEDEEERYREVLRQRKKRTAGHAVKPFTGTIWKFSRARRRGSRQINGFIRNLKEEINFKSFFFLPLTSCRIANGEKGKFQILPGRPKSRRKFHCSIKKRNFPNLFVRMIQVGPVNPENHKLNEEQNYEVSQN